MSACTCASREAKRTEHKKRMSNNKPKQSKKNTNTNTRQQTKWTALTSNGHSFHCIQHFFCFSLIKSIAFLLKQFCSLHGNHRTLLNHFIGNSEKLIALQSFPHNILRFGIVDIRILHDYLNGIKSFFYT